MPSLLSISVLGKKSLEDYSEINGQRTPSETMREENYFALGLMIKGPILA